jgi:hypothetical protein
LLASSPNPQARGPPAVGCPRLLIQYTRSYPPYWRPFLHPQTEDPPCCGDSDPLITWCSLSLRGRIKNLHVSLWVKPTCNTQSNVRKQLCWKM